MKMKLALLALLSVVAISPAHAISAKYRAQLEHSGCTQVSDANGTCDITKTKAQNAKAGSGYKALSADAAYAMNKPISDGAEYLLSKGWKPNNGEWHKSGYILRLVVENDKVVNSQLTK